MTTRLLEVRNLRLSVKTDEGTAYILDHVELTLPRGRILRHDEFDQRDESDAAAVGSLSAVRRRGTHAAAMTDRATVPPR
jgi:hypothetical protein